MTAKASITAVVSLACFVPLAAHANPYCADILKNGVYDQYHTLRDEAAFQTAKAVHCSENVSNVGKWSSTSGNVGYSAFAPDAEFNATSLEFEGQQFCKMNYEDYKASPRYKTAVTQMNLAIAATFPQCLVLNTRGVSHFVMPSQDPKTFTYKIVYTPRGNPASAKVTAWEVSGTASCTPSLKKDDVIDSAGLEAVCTRKSGADAVTITASADTGAKYLSRIQLLPMTEQPSRENLIARLPRQVLAAPYGDLRQGDSIASPSGNHVLTMLAAGNFVVCKAAEWQPGTGCSSPVYDSGTTLPASQRRLKRLRLQGDGNLAVLDGLEGRKCTITACGLSSEVPPPTVLPPYFLAVQDDGIVAYNQGTQWNNAGRPIWTSAGPRLTCNAQAYATPCTE